MRMSEKRATYEIYPKLSMVFHVYLFEVLISAPQRHYCKIKQNETKQKHTRPIYLVTYYKFKRQKKHQ